MSTNVRPPELLAPAGDRDCIRAAIESGADAVYFGLESGFNARARAANLHIDELPGVMSLLRGRGVKGYVTLNTLVFTDELPAIEEAVVRLTEAGVDAVLVQDPGLARLIRSVSPELSIHASTQMTLTNAACIRVAERLGIERVVLPRELSVAEIRSIREQTSIELEAFVHGALCVAYSGQCLTSESLGGRSANRGQCAQACRLPYDLICDGDDVELGDVKYLLSPQDLAAYDLVPQLMTAGVSCLKIEGRLKSAEYVANITRHYRRAIDAAAQHQPIAFSRQDVTEMELSFSRGFSPGWLNGSDHKMLVPGLSSAKRGVLIGRVQAVRRDRVAVRLSGELRRGDGIVFEGDREHDQEQGGRVYEIFRYGRSVTDTVRGGDFELTFRHGSLDPGRLRPEQAIWKTDDPKLTARLRKSFGGSQPVRRLPLDLQVAACVGERLSVRAAAANGATCEIESEAPLEAARKHPLTHDLLVEQFGRLGGTAFELRELQARIDGSPMVPLSVLGKLRRELVNRLAAATEQPPVRPIHRGIPAALRRGRGLHVAGEESGADDATRTNENVVPSLRVLCRDVRQLAEVVDFGIRSVIADLQDIREFRDAVEIARRSDVEIFLATPRIQKPGEEGIFRAMAKHQADGFLARNLAGIEFCREQAIPFVADFSLNAANPITVAWLRELGSRRVTVSYDLNRDQLLDLVSDISSTGVSDISSTGVSDIPSTGVSDASSQGLEVVIHQHMPMFHMEHCVFCAVMSPGTNKTNCGRPCDVHRVELRDRIGMEHPLKADVGCRNTLFNAVPQSAAEAVPTLLARGLRDFRVELLEDTGRDLQEMLKLYRELLAGRVRARDVWQRLQASNRVGVTRGTLEERRNPLAIL